MSYSEKILDHFQNPRNVGELEQPDAEARLEHPVCGDIMKLAVKVKENRIEDVRFRTRGCRSEEHTSELHSQSNLVCRLLLEKKKKKKKKNNKQEQKNKTK